MIRYVRTMTRRKFLKTAATGVALGLAGGPSFSLAKEEYDLTVISGTLCGHKKALEALGESPVLLKGQRVVLKPICPLPASGSGLQHAPLGRGDRSPSLHGCRAERVLVLDHTLQRASFAFNVRDSRSLQSIKAFMCWPFKRGIFSGDPGPSGKGPRAVEVMKEVLEAQVLINLPTAKSHSATGVSLGLRASWDSSGIGKVPLSIQYQSSRGRPRHGDQASIDDARCHAGFDYWRTGGPGEVKKPISSLRESIRLPLIRTVLP